MRRTALTDDEFEWEPPTEAEMKVLEAQRERQNKISKLMGDYLLKGYKMLGDCCQHCAVSLPIGADDSPNVTLSGET